mmetsp:Transcript_71691/g.213989  ORF Transcript_71691/g.213989 Transcript_71691/m.213989 type:complete len:242 (-) Transcript_71691:2859-3584(-)
MEVTGQLADEAGDHTAHLEVAQIGGGQASVHAAGAGRVIHLPHAQSHQARVCSTRGARRDAVEAPGQRLCHGAELADGDAQATSEALEQLCEGDARRVDRVLEELRVAHQGPQLIPDLLATDPVRQPRDDLAARHGGEVRDPRRDHGRGEAYAGHRGPQLLVHARIRGAVLAADDLGVPAHRCIRAHPDRLEGHRHQGGVVWGHDLQVVAGAVVAEVLRQAECDVAHATPPVGLLAELATC